MRTAFTSGLCLLAAALVAVTTTVRAYHHGGDLGRGMRTNPLARSPPRRPVGGARSSSSHTAAPSGSSSLRRRPRRRHRLPLRALPSPQAEGTNLSVGMPFEMSAYPTSAEEMIDAYRKYSANRGSLVSYEDAQTDVRAFMENKDIAEKWRPILMDAVKEKNKLSPVEIVNLITAYALPVVVGITFIPILRRVGEQIPFVNDVIIPNIDGGIGLLKTGVQKIINLPICLEFGDC